MSFNQCVKSSTTLCVVIAMSISSLGVARPMESSSESILSSCAFSSPPASFESEEKVKEIILPENVKKPTSRDSTIEINLFDSLSDELVFKIIRLSESSKGESPLRFCSFRFFELCYSSKLYSYWKEQHKLPEGVFDSVENLQTELSVRYPDVADVANFFENAGSGKMRPIFYYLGAMHAWKTHGLRSGFLEKLHRLEKAVPFMEDIDLSLDPEEIKKQNPEVEVAAPEQLENLLSLIRIRHLLKCADTVSEDVYDLARDPLFFESVPEYIEELGRSICHPKSTEAFFELLDVLCPPNIKTIKEKCHEVSLKNLDYMTRNLRLSWLYKCMSIPLLSDLAVEQGLLFMFIAFMEEEYPEVITETFMYLKLILLYQYDKLFCPQDENEYGPIFSYSDDLVLLADHLAIRVLPRTFLYTQQDLIDLIHEIQKFFSAADSDTLLLFHKSLLYETSQKEEE